MSAGDPPSFRVPGKVASRNSACGSRTHLEASPGCRAQRHSSRDWERALVILALVNRADGYRWSGTRLQPKSLRLNCSLGEAVGFR